MNTCLFRCALLASAAASGFSSPVTAQSTILEPAARQSVDRNGVDLISGAFTDSHTDLTIGSADQELSFTRYWSKNGWRHRGIVTISGKGANPVVSIGGSSESFTRTSSTSSGSTFTNDGNTGSSLTKAAGSAGDYVYKSKDGTVIHFTYAAGGVLSGFASDLAWASSIESPDGTIVEFHYKRQSFSGPSPGGWDLYGHAWAHSIYNEQLWISA
jgi:hypothetical protein